MLQCLCVQPLHRPCIMLLTAWSHLHCGVCRNQDVVCASFTVSQKPLLLLPIIPVHTDVALMFHPPLMQTLVFIALYPYLRPSLKSLSCRYYQACASCCLSSQAVSHRGRRGERSKEEGTHAPEQEDISYYTQPGCCPKPLSQPCADPSVYHSCGG